MTYDVVYPIMQGHTMIQYPVACLVYYMLNSNLNINMK